MIITKFPALLDHIDVKITLKCTSARNVLLEIVGPLNRCIMLEHKTKILNSLKVGGANEVF